MKTWVAILLGIAVLAVVAAGGAVWFFLKRPLTVYAWTTRSSLSNAGLSKGFTDSPAGRQCVFAGGHGPVVVLLHGAGDQAGTWSHVAPELVKRFTVVVPDLAGHGESAPRTGPIDFEQVLAGSEAVISRFAAGSRATVVGNSLGAWVALQVAGRHPEWVGRVVCVDGGALKGSNEHARVLPRNRAEAAETVAQTRDPKSPPIPGFVLDDIVRQASRGPLARFVATAATMDRWVMSEEQLRGLKVPVTVLWGASDRLMPLAYAERLTAAIPGATLTTLEDCGHVPQVECPKRFYETLAKVLGDTP